MPDPIQQYYEYLKKAGADVPSSFNSFKTTLSNENSAKQYFDYLKSNQFDAPDTFDSFANTLGLKKKDGVAVPSSEGLKTSTQEPSGLTPTKPSPKKGKEGMVSYTEPPSSASKFINIPQVTAESTKQLQPMLGAAPKEEDVDEMTGFSNAIKRGWNQGKITDMMALGQTPNRSDLKEIARINREQANIPSSDAYNRFNSAPDLSTAWNELKNNPFEIASQLIGESLSALTRHGYSRAAVGAAEGAAVGSVIPGIGTLSGLGTGYIAGMGLAGYNLEVASSILDSFREAGVDITNEKSLTDAFDNSETLEKARTFANRRAVPIALFDMFSAGMGGKLLGKPAKTILNKIGRTAGEAGIQAAGAGAGETTAQIASGQKINPTAILAEMVGEIGGGAPDIIVGTVIENKKQNQPINKEIINLDLKPDQFQDMIDISEASGEITDQQSNEIKQEFDKIQQIKQSVPDQYKKNAEVIEAIEKRKQLESQKQNLDPIFAKRIESDIAALDAKIDSIVKFDEEAVRTEELSKLPVKEQIKQKFQLTDQDFVAEPFTESEDAGYRNSMPLSGLENEAALETALNSEFAMLTAMNPQKQQISKTGNEALNKKAEGWLTSRGLTFTPIFGKYDNTERSYFVPNMTKEQSLEFAKEFKQDSVAHSSGLIYQDGSFNPRTPGVSFDSRFYTDANNYSSIVLGTPESQKVVDFSVNYDFDTTVKPDGTVETNKPDTVETRLGAEVEASIDGIVFTAQRSLASTGVTIDIIEDAAEYERRASEVGQQAGTEGMFISNDGKIIINKQKLNEGINAGRVIWHESSHPVVNIIRNTNPELFNRAVSGMKEAAKTDANVQNAINWAKENYQGEGVIDDESLVEVIASVADGTIDFTNAPAGFKQAIIDFVNAVAKALGLGQVLSDTDMVAFRKLASDVADALTSGRDIAEVVGAENVTEIGANLGDPVQLRKAEPKGEPVKVGEGYKLSFVKESDLIDINSLIKDIQDKGQKVWFWVADQLGRGMYYDKVIDGEHFLDAGPSFALDPENRSKNIIWASGMPKARAEKLIADSDYIFIISGSPTKSKLFNKRVAELVINRIKNSIGEENTYAKFKEQVLKVSKVSSLNNIVNEFNSFEDLIDSPKRKDFLNIINDQKDKKATDLKKLLDNYNAFVDYNELSDDFYRENGFEQNDIMLVLKPTGVGEKSAHSTYENDIIGDVIGVPDRKINSYDIMPESIRGQYGDLQRAQQSQVVAPYGAGVRQVQASKGGRVNLISDAGLDKKMTSDDKGNYLFYHYSDKNLKSIKPSKFGKNLATGRDEKPGVGLSMYYTRPDQLEANVPNDFGYVVRVPEDKVYPFNQDPLNLLPEAEKRFNKRFPGMAFDFNKQVGFVTEVAADRGYPMTVAEWNIRGTKALRAQTTKDFKPELYSNVVPGTLNQFEYNPELAKFKPNARRRPQASMGGRGMAQKLKTFVNNERGLGTPDADIEAAIRNRFPSITDAEVNDIMQKPTVSEPTVEEKAAAIVEPTGKEKTRGMEKRFGGLDSDTYKKIEDEAKKYFSQSNKQTEAAAEEFMKGKPVEFLADYVVSNPNIPGAVNVWMAAATAKKLGTEIDAAKKAGDVDRVELLSAARANIYNHFSQKATEVGQTIQAFVSFKDDPSATQFMFNKILKQLDEKGVTGITEDQKAEIKRLLDEVSNAPAGLPKDIAITGLSHYLGKITPINAFDIAQAIWYAKILSGITTQSKNFFANIFNTFTEVPIVGIRMSVQTRSLQPMFYAMKGLGGGSIKGLVKAADIMKSGITSKSEDKFFNNDNLLEYFKWSDTKLGKTFGGLTGKILDFPLFFETSPTALKYVGRALTASDAIFSTANQEAMANMMAFAQAKAEGKQGIPANTYKRVQEILNNTKQSVQDAKVQASSEGFNPGTVQYKRRVIELVNQKRGDDIVNVAEEFGKRATLTNEPEGFTRGIYQVATNIQEKLPLSRVMIPFTKIVSNMAENMINYSPAGMYRALTGIRNPKISFKYTPSGNNKLTVDERADLFIKSAIGLTALTILASKIGDDEDDWFDITAGGPSEFSKKYELMKGGWRPYTITFKDGTKVNYSDWPISGVFSALGTILDTERYGDVEDPSAVGEMIIGAAGFLSVFYDKSLLKGMSDFFDIFKQDGKYGVGSENFIERTAKNTAKFGAQQAKAITMSNFSQQVLKLTDEFKDNPIKEAKGAELLYRDIPILNDGLNPIVDVFGDPVTYATTERLLPWMSVSDEKKDSIIAYLNRNNIFVGMAPEKSFVDINTGEERKMTRDELYNYRKLAGQYSKEMLQEYLDTVKDVKEMEKDLGKGLAKNVVSDIVSAARERAYIEIVLQ